MKITLLTAGTGSYYCGACMRDNALVKGLRSLGHDAHLVPMYLPLQLDEERVDGQTPVFFGGLNVYLQQKFRLFRKLPRWVDRFFNAQGLLRALAKRSHMTSAREQGEMTYQMLCFEDSHLDKELDKLVDWLEKDGTPEVVVLSNALLVGLAKPLKARLGSSVSVACTFQGEDSFLDGLPEPWKSKAWSEMSARLYDADVVVSPSRFYSELMKERTGVDSVVIPNGVDLSGYRAGAAEGKIGYLARMCHSKGLGLLVDAFIEMNHPSAHLAIAGTMGGGDDQYVEGLKNKLEQAGLGERVQWLPDLDREAKAQFLSELAVFCVPVQYPEAFGLYLIEAMACGVPVVMPNASAFPEIVEGAGCGFLVEEGSVQALAKGLEELFDHPERRAIGEKGRIAAEDRYHVGAMAKQFEMLFKEEGSK